MALVKTINCYLLFLLAFASCTQVVETCVLPCLTSLRDLWQPALQITSVAMTYTEYKELGYQNLHKELKKMLQQAQRLSIWFNAAERLNLLPALQAMHDLVAQPGRRHPDPANPSWEDECRILGITPEMVRQWRYRTAADADIRHLLGEERKAAKREPAQDAKLMERRFRQLAVAVAEGDEKADSLAFAFIELYQW